MPKKYLTSYMNAPLLNFKISSTHNVIRTPRLFGTLEYIFTLGGRTAAVLAMQNPGRVAHTFNFFPEHKLNVYSTCYI